MHVDMDIEATAPVVRKANAAVNMAGVALVLIIMNLPLQLHQHQKKEKVQELNGLYEASVVEGKGMMCRV